MPEPNPVSSLRPEPHPENVSGLRLVNPDVSAELNELRAIRRLLRVLVARTPKPPLSLGGLRMPAVEQAVLRVCTNKPQTAKRIAGLIGYSLSRTRDAITRLTSTEPPVLVRVTGGLRLPVAGRK